MRLPFVLLALVMAPLPAQRAQASPSVQRWLLHPPGTVRAAWTLSCVLPGDQNLLRDQSSYLSLLQRRFGDRGLRVMVLLRGAAADATPAVPGADYSLGCLGAEQGRAPDTWGDYSPARLLDGHGREVWSGLLAQGVAPAIELALQGKADVDRAAAAARLRSDLLIRIGDGGVFRPQIDQLLRLAPGDAHALALSYLDQLATGEPAAARRTVRQAIAELQGEPLPLFAFADLALRAERDPVSLRLLLTAIEAGIGPCDDSPLLQLIRLRALLRAGRAREAGRLVSQLPKWIGDRPMELVAFAETLADGSDPQPWRATAERALQRAEQLGADPRWLFAARYKVAALCAEDPQLAAGIASAYRLRKVNMAAPNDDSWQLMTRLDTMGRFDPMALWLADEQERQDGQQVLFQHLDTKALALFRNGRYDDAITVQEQAAKLAGNRATYTGRLERYRRCKLLRLDNDEEVKR